MSDCCNPFVFTDDGDSFASWQGLRGPAGPQGPAGAPGTSVELRGPVATTGDLPATAPSSELWLVGAAAPYNGYFYNGSSWEDAGEIAVGPTGPAGADGAAATIAVGTVSGLPAGSTPTVTNAGTSAAAVFDFGIPAGADGAAGPGVPAAGTAGQYLVKQSSTDYDTAWETRARIVNPNLLDNWYFVKGSGTTGNYGVFPVNQRRQSSYSTSNAYTIDRWKLTSGSLTVTSSGITLNGTIVQILPTSIGQTVTASALLSDGTMITPTYDDSTKTFTLTAAGSTIVAAKLEIGGVQTLAHQESGLWVLNAVANYEEELPKCKLYFERIKGIMSPVGLGYALSSGVVFMQSLCAPKRTYALECVTLSGSIWVWRSAAYAGSSYETATISNTAVTEAGVFIFQAQVSGFTASEGVSCQFRDGNSYLDISCDL